MNSRERQKEILRLIENGEELLVDQACRHCGASPATIRRDFLRLEAEQRVEKTWGGVRARGRAFNLMPPYPERLSRQTESKKRIARTAANLVQDGDVLFIDGGTTTVHLAPFLASKKIRVVTNSLVIAHDMDRARKGSAGAEVFLTGGLLFPQSELLVGPRARETLQAYRAQWAFLSVSGLDLRGASNHEERIVEVERAMIEGCERLALLADHSKCGIRSMVHLCDWSEVDVWVTDQNPGKSPLTRAIRKAGVQIHITSK
jgi:DeoR/GlpR family transcriptional regulator of sugar metabolism